MKKNMKMRSQVPWRPPVLAFCDGFEAQNSQKSPENYQNTASKRLEIGRNRSQAPSSVGPRLASTRSSPGGGRRGAGADSGRRGPRRRTA